MNLDNIIFHTLSDHQKFEKDFLYIYKQEEVLWKTDHPNYKNRSERQEALEKLVLKCREYYREADEDYVRNKIKTFRTVFQKEYKKVVKSKQNTADPKYIYKPSLWYYNLLLFLEGEECDEHFQDKVVNENEKLSTNDSVMWEKKDISILIRLYKMFPCLYESTAGRLHGLVRRRKEALIEITNKLMKLTGKNFKREAVRKRISTLRSQFVKEHKKVQENSKNFQSFRSSWWCYKMLDFLIPVITSTNLSQQDPFDFKKIDTQLEGDSEESCGDGTADNYCEIKLISHLELPECTMNDKKIADVQSNPLANLNETTPSIIEDNSSSEIDKDIFDTIGRNVAHQLRTMTAEQRKIAEKLVKDVMYYGQMEELTRESNLHLVED